MPNLHPMVVHFPIALLMVAFAVDLVALFFRRIQFLPRMSTILYIIGALGTLGAVLSGEAAADSLLVTGEASTVLTTHSDLGEITMWWFLSYGVLRIALWWWLSFKLVVWIPVTIIGAVGLLPLIQAASFGGDMVYEHGVGVAVVDSMSAKIEVQEEALMRLRGVAGSPILEDNGAWQWIPGPDADDAFNLAFDVVTGEVAAEVTENTAGNTELSLTIVTSPVLITYGKAVESVEFRAVMDLSEFDGSVRMVHHVQDSLSYHFLELENGTMRLGAASSGVEEIHNEAVLPNPEARTIGVVGDRTHVRGYADDIQVTHGHGQAPEAGLTGFMIRGSGKVKLGRMRLMPLR
ncbi:MAG: hypothetical protein OXI44_12250 [Bacteroidota bacterium]|nr:hypothetical protein [Bacteroidota bacterium]